MMRGNSMDYDFGKVRKSWAGYAFEKKIALPYFESEVEIFLGEEFDEDGEEVSSPPSTPKVKEYQQTLKVFLDGMDIGAIQQSCHEYYESIYAKYYEKPFEVIFENSLVKAPENGELHPPLGLDTKEKHFMYMKKCLGSIRILDDKTIKIPIRYALDEEHGMEIKIACNQVVKVDGIAET